MNYIVTIVDISKGNTVHEHIKLNEVMNLMNKFVEDHPSCHMFRPFSDGITAFEVNEDNKIYGLVVEEDMGY